MSGKAMLIVISGFTMLFMVVANNFNTVSGRVTDNYVDYFNKTTSHNIAISGANMAANQLFLDSTWNTGYSNLDYQNGKLNVTVQTIDAYKNIKRVTSIGIFRKDTSRVEVTFAPSKFSKFAYYSIYEGTNIWWMNKDTVWGPFHTQDKLRAANHPVFFGKASSKGGIQYYTNQATDKPYFYGGYEQGVDLTLPTNGVTALKTPAQNNGIYFNGNDAGKGTVYLKFNGDYLLYRYSTMTPYDSIHLPTSAPNGVIYIDNGIARIQGTVKGAYTIACSGSSSGKGTIWLDDDIVYSKDPRIYPTSTDMLGIVAQSNVWITDNTPNRDNININASIYVQSGGFGAEKYDTRPISGTINLLGGIIQNTRQAVGTFSGGVIKTGFSKSYRYDTRFMTASPPFFPGTGGFEIVSWYE
ncbi:MAG: hypothetical protein LDL01_03925 [Ignavibacterium sp.]|uniref:hypothetical protein n=1 Tax=Ignavibacterium album TaxID=591197 RepID=UPI0026F20CB0|nr:hypothetical protein [Ignavibacterium album]MCA2004925.1 hypothetical protein [Ignavibacterium sp.]MCX8105280.1 hypothetical protein [Ignavibacterium album]